MSNVLFSGFTEVGVITTSLEMCVGGGGGGGRVVGGIFPMVSCCDWWARHRG